MPAKVGMTLNVKAALSLWLDCQGWGKVKTVKWDEYDDVWASQEVLVVKRPPAHVGDIKDTLWSLGWEDLLEEGKATHSSILPWRMPRTRELDGLQSVGSQRVGHDWSNLAHTWCCVGLSVSAMALSTKAECLTTFSGSWHTLDGGKSVDKQLRINILRQDRKPVGQRVPKIELLFFF